MAFYTYFYIFLEYLLNFVIFRMLLEEYSWKICIKFNTFYMFQMVHSNFCVNLTQDEYVRK